MRQPLWLLLSLLSFALFFAAGCSSAPPVAPQPTAPQPVTPNAAVSASAAGADADTAQAPVASDLLRGIGVLGDSFYDEYQGTDGRGGEYHAVTFNLVELLARDRGFHFGAWGEWGEPRREGYQYNWARSGATSSSMIEMGQHTGLAEQIAEGRVTFVFIGVGGNDFSPYYGNFFERIYTGDMSDDELADKVAAAIANLTLAVDTVQQAGAQGVAITMFTQWNLDPTVYTLFPDANRRQRVAQAIDAVNAGLQAMAAERGVAVIDQNQYGTEVILPHLSSEGFLDFGGEPIDFLHHGDEPHHSRLADQQHLGTIMSGLTANYYFIDTLNRSFGQAIAPLSEEEILREAGLRP